MRRRSASLSTPSALARSLPSGATALVSGWVER
jgi:hypothetical protein